MIHSEQLRAFVAFGDAMNFTRAAERLHISQPALHVQIRKLGESLGVALYLRRGRKLELTEAGRKLLAFGRDQHERTETLVADLRLETRDDTVVLAAGEGTFLYLLADAMKAFQRLRPARLRVLTRDRDGALSAVQLGDAHLAVTVVDEVPEDLVARRVARVGAAVIMPSSHRLARQRSVSIQALDGESLVVPAAGRPLRAALAGAWAAAGTRLSPSVEASGWQLMMCFAQLGLGLAIVNDFCKPPSGMVRRPLSGLPPVHYQLLRRRDRQHGPTVRQLEEAIVAAARVASTRPAKPQ
jgi:LysR family transcriptional regulator, low CO2-responsive transcriptional regulator